jgi:hypothetical protein
MADLKPDPNSPRGPIYALLAVQMVVVYTALPLAFIYIGTKLTVEPSGWYLALIPLLVLYVWMTVVLARLTYVWLDRNL